MQIYNYHPVSGEFVGISEADKSPMDDEWLIPAHATTIAPPEKLTEGHVAVWLNGEWGEAPDHRGELWFDAEGHEMTIRQLGDPLEHGLVKEPPPEPEMGRIRFALVNEETGLILMTLEGEIAFRWEKVDGYFMAVDEKGEASPGGHFDFQALTFSPPATEEPQQ